MYEIKKENSSMIMKKREIPYANDKEEMIFMPTMDMIESERMAYVKEMEQYLDDLKSMNRQEAQKKSFENLVQSQIIYANGQFTEHYDF